jgi:hypothetical protein
MRTWDVYFAINVLFDYDAILFSTYNIFKYLGKPGLGGQAYEASFGHPDAVKSISRYLPYVKPRSYSISLRWVISEPVAATTAASDYYARLPGRSGL